MPFEVKQRTAQEPSQQAPKQPHHIITSPSFPEYQPPCRFAATGARRHSLRRARTQTHARTHTKKHHVICLLCSTLTLNGWLPGHRQITAKASGNPIRLLSLECLRNTVLQQARLGFSNVFIYVPWDFFNTLFISRCAQASTFIFADVATKCTR